MMGFSYFGVSSRFLEIKIYYEDNEKKFKKLKTYLIICNFHHRLVLDIYEVESFARNLLNLMKTFEDTLS